MARKRRVGRPRVKGGPRKMTNRSVHSYMNRGLASALKKGGRKRGTFKKTAGGKRRGRKAGFHHSAATIKKIAAGLRAAHKAGKFKNRKRRVSGRKRRA